MMKLSHEFQLLGHLFNLCRLLPGYAFHNFFKAQDMSDLLNYLLAIIVIKENLHFFRSPSEKQLAGLNIHFSLLWACQVIMLQHHLLPDKLTPKSLSGGGDFGLSEHFPLTICPGRYET